MHSDHFQIELDVRLDTGAANPLNTHEQNCCLTTIKANMYWFIVHLLQKSVSRSPFQKMGINTDSPLESSPFLL